MDSRKMKRKLCTRVLLLKSVAIVLVAFGASFAVFWPQIFDAILAGELKLSPSSKIYEQWKKPNVSLYFDVYFFNWTNPNDIFDETIKPIFDEIGPYRFLDVRDKTRISFNRNSTVSYRNFQTFYFDADGSNGTLDDVLTTLNMVALGANANARNMNYMNRKKVSLGLNLYKQNIHVTQSARELLFEGYEDDMLLMAREKLIEGFENIEVPYDRVGFFYKRNATDEMSSTLNIHTGSGDASNLGTIDKFNNLDFNPYYPGECRKLHGSANGELFPQQQTRDGPLNIFLADICRTVPFDYETDIVVDGITGYRFTAGERAVDNGTKYPENSCYTGFNGESVPSGVMNISACRYSSPVFMSYPHFYAADEFYSNEVDGLEPIREKHESYIILEPITGVPLEINMRFQVNMYIQPTENIALYQEAPTIFMPLLWFEERFTMDQKDRDQMKQALAIRWIGRLLGIVVLAIGIILLLLISIVNCMKKRQKPLNISNLTDRTVEGTTLLNQQAKPQMIQPNSKTSTNC